jgi:DNA invertase Pin-like site-specific DNA recombinase
MKTNDKPTLKHPLITPEHLGRKALPYIRQSSVEQVEKNTGSQTFQRNQVELARSYGWPDHLIEVIDEDLGKSGSTVDRRTGWQRMLKEIAANKVGAVFSVNVSRLGREMLPVEELRILAAHHGTLLCLDGRFSDPANPNDTVLTQITASIAQYENKKRTEHMSAARMAKARSGAVVSALPVGWIKCPDGKFDYDPEVKDVILAIFDTFQRVRSIRGTVKALTEAGIKVPSKRGRRINLIKPTLGNLRRLLINPAYAGTYVYGKTESRRGGPVLATGQSPRVKVPEHRWVKVPNHHPAYMTVEQQEEIKRVLRDNNFVRHNRPGRGHAITQGLLRCAICKRSLCVNYHRGKSYSYGCGWESEPCTRFVSYEFDGYVLSEVFKVLKAPPLEMLKAALADSKSKEVAHKNWIESERERLRHEEQKARERADLSRACMPRVHLDALQKLEDVLQEREEFEQKIALELSNRKVDETEEELEELCRLASDIPGLWNHPAVTHQERKEILRCLIDHIVVTATKERIDATIVWQSGAQTPIFIWRGNGRYNLIRELHSRNLTVFEIQEHLAAGKTSTGQKMNICVGRLYDALQKVGLKPNRFSAEYLSLRQKALSLSREGRSLEWISAYFNEQGFKSPSGKPWTRDMVYGLLRAQGKKPVSLEETHRAAIREARDRGLNYREMAEEFNERGIRRRDGQAWTARDIKKRWGDLNRLERKRAEKGSNTTELSEPVVLQESA